MADRLLAALVIAAVAIQGWRVLAAWRAYQTAKRNAAGSERHPFAERCPHGIQFLDECEGCPGGWQPTKKPACGEDGPS